MDQLSSVQNTSRGRREIEKFYDQWRETYQECRRESAIVLIGGDRKSKLGLRQEIFFQLNQSCLWGDMVKVREM